MRETKLQLGAISLLLILSGMLGCQSGPRWAWWKSDVATPEDTSLVARSAPAASVASASAPGLPSQQATPQNIAAQTTTSPSKAQTASTLPATPGVPPVSIPAGSANTIASAPTASYSPAATQTVAAPPSSYSSFAPPSSASIAAASVSPATAVAPVTTGPYDPNAYRGTATIASTAASDDGLTGDRYSMQPNKPTGINSTPENRYASIPGQSADRYTAAGTTGTQPNSATPLGNALSYPATQGMRAEQASASVPSSSDVGDRYAMSNVSAASAIAATQPSSDTAASVKSTAASGSTGATSPTNDAGNPSVYANPLRADAANSAPSTTSVTTTLPAVPVANPATQATGAPTYGTGTVKLASPPGQYRPAGTSDYPATKIDVASRPTPMTGSSAYQAAPAATSYPPYPATEANNTGQTPRY